MNMQQIMMQAQKMKRDLEKALAAFREEELTIEKAGFLKVTMTGGKVIKAIDIDADALDKDNKEMVEETIKLAINELIEKIDAKEEEINKKITGGTGLGF